MPITSTVWGKRDPKFISVSDINECEVYGTCPQVCKNTKGGYDCECAPGYRKVGNGKMCEAEGENNLLQSLCSLHGSLKSIF